MTDKQRQFLEDLRAVLVEHNVDNIYAKNGGVAFEIAEDGETLNIGDANPGIKFKTTPQEYRSKFRRVK